MRVFYGVGVEAKAKTPLRRGLFGKHLAEETGKTLVQAQGEKGSHDDPARGR